jgi:pimeloyl-ACP methyl ester carboxylesterase
VEVDAAIYQTKPDSQFLQWLFETPQLDHLGPLIARRLAGASGEDFIRSAWHNPSQLDKQPEILDGYRLPLQIENWDIALWEFTKVSPAANLAEHLDQINIPSLVISGRDDQIVPLENSIRLAEDLPLARLEIIEDCGHLPQEECPEAFIQDITNFLSNDLYRNGK